MTQVILQANSQEVDIAKIDDYLGDKNISIDVLKKQASQLTDELNKIAQEVGVQSDKYIASTRELTKLNTTIETVQEIITLSDELVQSHDLLEDELLADEAQEEI